MGVWLLPLELPEMKILIMDAGDTCTRTSVPTCALFRSALRLTCSSKIAVNGSSMNNYTGATGFANKVVFGGLTLNMLSEITL